MGHLQCDGNRTGGFVNFLSLDGTTHVFANIMPPGDTKDTNG